MDFREDTQNKVAIVLSVFEYTAVSLLALAIIGQLLKIPTAGTLNITGTALVALAPVAGIITAGVVLARHNQLRLAVYSSIILGIYIIAFLAAR
ncbi:MAG: hypothetical protein V3W18_02590 [candidate division Zixibacteria bacterium]